MAQPADATPNTTITTDGSAITIASRIAFAHLATFLQQLADATTVPRKTVLLKEYYASFTTFRLQFCRSNAITPDDDVSSAERTSFFPVLRLLVPKLDQERPACGIRTKTMGKLLVRILAVDPHSEVAQLLMRRHDDDDNEAAAQPAMGKQPRRDYADIVYEVMRHRATTAQGGGGGGAKMTVQTVNERLDRISRYYQEKQRELIDNELLALLTGMSPLEQKWLIRIVLRRVAFGLGGNTVLTALHPDAVAVYARTTHLSQVCRTLQSNSLALRAADDQTTVAVASTATVQPGQPFFPMLCDRVRLADIERLLANHTFYVETKLDGERFQLHRLTDNTFRYFSRRGHDYSEHFERTLTGALLRASAFLRHPGRDCILDGEMMVWDTRTGRYRHKAEQAADVKALRGDGPLQPVFVAYDVLWLDGQCLTGKPYAERRRVLRDVVRADGGEQLRRGEPERIRDAEHVLECVNRAIDGREEGVVLKREDAAYVAGSRKAGWYKVKPDYIDNIARDLDLLILGGFWNGSRTAVHKFVLGVHDRPPTIATSTSEPGRFHACTNVWSGLSVADLETLNEQLRPHWRPLGAKAAPADGVRFGDTVPDVWIDPAASVVLQVRAAELVPTRSFATRFSLRFPRVEAVRTDKPWHDCCTLREFEELCSTTGHQVHKLTKRHLNQADLVPKAKRAKTLSGPSPLLATSNARRGYADPLPLEQLVDNVCAGLEFHIIGGIRPNNGPTVEELCALVRSHGGTLVANPTSRTYACIATPTKQPSLKLSTMCTHRSHNIASDAWLLHALGGTHPRSKLAAFRPADMLCTTDELRAQFRRRFDVHNDALGELISDVRELKAILDSMTTVKRLSRSEMYALERELHTPAKPEMFYRLATAFFAGTGMEHAELLFRWYGGRVLSAEELQADGTEAQRLSHVFVDTKDEKEEAFSEDVFRREYAWNSAVTGLKIVSSQWIMDCHRQKRKIRECSYLVHGKKLHADC